VLVCHGADDPHVSGAEVVAFQQEMRDAGTVRQFVHYPDADTITFATTSFSPLILTVADRVTHTISVSAGLHRSVAPGGEVTVNEGSDRAFDVVADRLYRVDSVSTNGQAVPYAFGNSDTNYTFTWPNVLAP